MTRLRVPVQIGEELHFLLRQHVVSRPRVLMTGFKAPRKVSMDRFLDWVVLPLLKGKALAKLDALARRKAIPLHAVMAAVYELAASRPELLEGLLPSK